MPAWLSRDRLAVLAGLLAPLALAGALVPFRDSIPNTDAALAMILVVVAVAANGNRLAGYLAAVSTAVWFDFFLTRPYERFTINRQTDIETTVLLLVIGVAVTELAVWGRRQQTAASRRAGYLDGMRLTGKGVMLRRVYTEAMARVWLKHNVEEVGNFEFFLPALHAAHAARLATTLEKG